VSQAPESSWPANPRDGSPGQTKTQDIKGIETMLKGRHIRPLGLLGGEVLEMPLASAARGFMILMIYGP